MNTIPAENRREAYEAVKEDLRETVVMATILGWRERFGGGLTPEDIAGVLGWDITMVRPRTTMLNAKGRLTVIGKRKNAHGRNVSVYAPVIP